MPDDPMGTLESVCGESRAAIVRTWITALVPKIEGRSDMVLAMCHMMRRSHGASACHLCYDNECSNTEAHAAADLALAYVEAQREVVISPRLSRDLFFGRKPTPGESET
jgi:hypothetical protein